MIDPGHVPISSEKKQVFSGPVPQVTVDEGDKP